jgi:hypothetical protein
MTVGIVGVASALLGPGHPRIYIHGEKDVDARLKPGHDELSCCRHVRENSNSSDPSTQLTQSGRDIFCFSKKYFRFT